MNYFLKKKNSISFVLAFTENFGLQFHYVIPLNK